MATKVVESTSTDLVKWEQELARQALEAAEQEASTGGGQFFSLRGGQLKFNGAQLPDNQMAVVILDSILENVYYDGPFDPDDPQTPVCYAMGRDEKTLAPMEGCEQPQAEGCAECPHGQWGSKGRGKACRNRRRLALIPAGTLAGNKFTAYSSADEVAAAPLAYLALPPTSIAPYATYVKQLAGALNRPPRAVFTKVAVVPDTKSQFKVTFTPLGGIPVELLSAVMTRAKEVAAVIMFPYQQAGSSVGSTHDKKDKDNGRRGGKRKY